MINFICIYNAWDIITGNTAVSLLLTYVVQKFILSINKYLSFIYSLLVISAKGTFPRKPC
jgi:hypothetical protein